MTVLCSTHSPCIPRLFIVPESTLYPYYEEPIDRSLHHHMCSLAQRGSDSGIQQDPIQFQFRDSRQEKQSHMTERVMSVLLEQHECGTNSAGIAERFTHSQESWAPCHFERRASYVVPHILSSSLVYQRYRTFLCYSAFGFFDPSLLLTVTCRK